MKTIMILSAVLLLLTVPAFAELSSADLEKIRTIIKEEVAAVETRLMDRIERSEEHLKDYVTQEIGKVNIKIDEMDKRLTGEIIGLKERFNQLFALVTVLLTAVIAIVGVPLAIVLFQLKRQAAEQKAFQQIQRSQGEKIEALQQDLADRKQGTIITP